jgi:hypothetical protein
MKVTKHDLIILLTEARVTNDSRDEMERQAGFAPPSIGGDDLWARTIIEALHCGLKTDDLKAIAEGLVMLVDLEFKLRGYNSRAKLNSKYEPWK